MVWISGTCPLESLDLRSPGPHTRGRRGPRSDERLSSSLGADAPWFNCGIPQVCAVTSAGRVRKRAVTGVGDCREVRLETALDLGAQGLGAGLRPFGKPRSPEPPESLFRSWQPPACLPPAVHSGSARVNPSWPPTVDFRLHAPFCPAGNGNHGRARFGRVGLAVPGCRQPARCRGSRPVGQKDLVSASPWGPGAPGPSTGEDRAGCFRRSDRCVCGAGTLLRRPGICRVGKQQFGPESHRLANLRLPQNLQSLAFISMALSSASGTRGLF